MKKLKLYLDTSVLGGIFETEVYEADGIKKFIKIA